MMKSISNIILVVVYLLIVATGIYSLMWLIKENKIENFIIGEYIEETPVNQISDFEYTFNSLLFTNTGIENEYMSVATTGKVSGFDKNKTYTTTVNGKLSNRVPGDYEFVNSIHTKKFYDVNNNLLLSDDLQVSVNFHENGTEFKILTRGGEAAVSYWQKFIANEGLTIKIVECDYSAKIEADNLPEYILNLYFEETIIETISINALRQFELPTRYETYHITDWVDINQISYTKETLPIKNLDLYAVVAPYLLFELNDSKLDYCDDGEYVFKPVFVQNEDEQLSLKKIYENNQIINCFVILEYGSKEIILNIPEISIINNGPRFYWLQGRLFSFDFLIGFQINYDDLDKICDIEFLLDFQPIFEETPDGSELSNMITNDTINNSMSFNCQIWFNLAS